MYYWNLFYNSFVKIMYFVNKGTLKKKVLTMDKNNKPCGKPSFANLSIQGPVCAPCKCDVPEPM